MIDYEKMVIDATKHIQQKLDQSQSDLEQANKDIQVLAEALIEATNFIDVAFRPQRHKALELANKHLKEGGLV